MKKPNLQNIKEKASELAINTGKVIKDVAEDIPEKLQSGKSYIGEQYDKAKYEIDLKRLQPIFAEDLSERTQKRPRWFRVVEYDKRLENEACKNSIGFEEKIKREDVIHFYSKDLELLKVNFYPCIQETIYCINPYNENMYISLEEYFTYIKKAKVDELQKIAHSLGAKEVKISLKERKKTFIVKDSKTTANGTGKANGTIEQKNQNEELMSVEVAADIKFSGDAPPKMPELTYFKYDKDIEALIKMRCNEESANQIKEKTYRISYFNSSEMQEETAIKIDTVLQQLGCAGNSTVQSEVQTKKRMELEYYVLF